MKIAGINAVIVFSFIDRWSARKFLQDQPVPASSGRRGVAYRVDKFRIEKSKTRMEKKGRVSLVREYVSDPAEISRLVETKIRLAP
jgi:hypothetical protein